MSSSDKKGARRHIPKPRPEPVKPEPEPEVSGNRERPGVGMERGIVWVDVDYAGIEKRTEAATKLFAESVSDASKRAAEAMNQFAIGMDLPMQVFADGGFMPTGRGNGKKRFDPWPKIPEPTPDPNTKTLHKCEFATCRVQEFWSWPGVSIPTCPACSVVSRTKA